MRQLLVSFWVMSLLVACTPRERPTKSPALPGAASSARTVSPASPAGSGSSGRGAGAFATGHYRNLFAEFGHLEARSKLESAYRQLFHGDPDSEAVFFPTGQNANGRLAYVMDVGNKDIRSEGMSYGMMIAVEMNKKDDFDALWNWARTNMFHGEAKHPCHGYFSWQMRSDGTAIDEMPAPDAEEYFITALFFASHLWGDGTGIYDYGQEARDLLDRVKNRELIEGTVNGSRRASVVALFHPQQKMVRFTPDTGNFAKSGDHTDPSYHLPAFYRLWAEWGPGRDHLFWLEAAAASRAFFAKAAHPKTGLTPDYAEFDGRPKAAPWEAKTVEFRFDAWRTAMNWAVDAVWWAEDPFERDLSDRVLRFFAGQGPSYAANFTLDGRPTVTYSSLGLRATNAVVALAAGREEIRPFVEALYEAEPPKGQWRYYDGLLYLMAFLHVSGEFRVIEPPAH